MTGDVDYAKLESEIAARKVAEVVVPRTQLEDMRADIEFLRAAQEAADAMVHQHQLVRMWLDIERRLEEAKVGLRVEFWEVGLRLEHEIFWTKVNCLPPASQEVFFLRADAEHVLQRQQQQQQQQQPESESEMVELGAGVAGVGAGQEQQQQQQQQQEEEREALPGTCLLYTSPSPRD